MNIVVLDGYTANPGDLNWSALETLGAVEIYDRTTSHQVIERCQNAEIVLTNKVCLGQQHFEALPNLKYIGVLATGTNVIDLQAAQQYKLTVTNVPAYSTDSVAQLVMSYILHFAFAVGEHHGRVQSGDWVQASDFSFTCGSLVELKGKTLGIIGCFCINGANRQ
jgi:glycerate dehydrogenase